MQEALQLEQEHQQVAAEEEHIFRKVLVQAELGRSIGQHLHLELELLLFILVTMQPIPIVVPVEMQFIPKHLL